MKFKNAIKHFITITSHKVAVTRLCFQCGLYKQGLIHDLSKYSPAEFFSSVKYYTGTSSPIEEEKRSKGYSLCWLHHRSKNKHHWQYWLDECNGNLKVYNMPDKYIFEMFCDRVAACKTYQKKKYTQTSALDYFKKDKDRLLMGSYNAEKLEFLLTCLSVDGEKEILKSIKTYQKEKLTNPSVKIRFSNKKENENENGSQF